MFIGIEGIARKVTGAHIGVDGVARRVKKAYIGVDGVARLAWEAGEGSGGGESGPVRAYLYNGMKLPELPKWDRETYPYVVITKNVNFGTFFAVSMCQSPVCVKPDESGRDWIHFSPRLISQISSLLDETEWGDMSAQDVESEFMVVLEQTGLTNFYDIIWSNHDVLKSDGTVHIAASNPVPLCSYNGMELPELPEWDTTEYPYACIARSALGLYTFGASKSPVLVYNGNNGKPRCDWNPPYLRSTIWANSDKWPELQYEEDFTGSDLSSDISMWANYDIEYNGEVIVTASEPVPVYI